MFLSNSCVWYLTDTGHIAEVCAKSHCTLYHFHRSFSDLAYIPSLLVILKISVAESLGISNVIFLQADVPLNMREYMALYKS